MESHWRKLMMSKDKAMSMLLLSVMNQLRLTIKLLVMMGFVGKVWIIIIVMMLMGLYRD